MIRVYTEAGPVEVDADAEHVSISGGGRLEVRRDSVLVAQFRRWTHWHETTTAAEEAS